LAPADGPAEADPETCSHATAFPDHTYAHRGTRRLPDGPNAGSWKMLRNPSLLALVIAILGTATIALTPSLAVSKSRDTARSATNTQMAHSLYNRYQLAPHVAKRGHEHRAVARWEYGPHWPPGFYDHPPGYGYDANGRYFRGPDGIFWRPTGAVVGY
jgi:hypothetical protein